MNIMLLMIITPPDSHIARFTVKKLGQALSEKVNLCIYFNGLSPKAQRRIRKLVKHNAHVVIKDNYDDIMKDRESIASQVGKTFLTASGHATELREGLYEPQAEIWSTELVKFNDFDLVGIVDPDFEVFEPDFIDRIVDAFVENDQLGFFSVDFSPSVEYYDSYSREQCVLEQRYHTWFCAYRRRALEHESNFYFHEERGEHIRKWDHSARLQETLRVEHDFTGSALPREHQWKFLHYGAFAQNRSLKGVRLWVYRLLRIGKHNGFVHVHRIHSLSSLIQRLSEKCYDFLQMNKYDREREHYIYEAQ